MATTKKTPAKEETKKTQAKTAEKAVKKDEKPAKKAPSTKAPAKETAKKAEKKPAKTSQKTKEPTKKTAEKKAANQVYFEFANKQIDAAKLEDMAKKAYVASGGKAADIKSLKLYVKAEDQAMYYVVNDGKTGKVAL